MPRKFGPTRAELKFRLSASLAGLTFLIGAVLYRGLPSGPAFIEVGVIGSAFFGGTAIWAARRLIRRDHPD
jgi:hypothetical protein